MTEDATAIAEFWVQGEHLFILFFTGAICLDNVHVEICDFKTAIQFPTSIRSGQESRRIYLNETGKKSPHGERKPVKKIATQSHCC